MGGRLGACTGSNVGADFDSQVDRWWFNGAYSTIVNPCPSVIDYLGDLINVFTTGGLEVRASWFCACSYNP